MSNIKKKKLAGQILQRAAQIRKDIKQLESRIKIRNRPIKPFEKFLLKVEVDFKQRPKLIWALVKEKWSFHVVEHEHNDGVTFLIKTSPANAHKAIKIWNKHK